ncbi:MAG: 3'(2'),5'-bisphosphate nucleotidase CysQ [Acidimicrobiia bacterium]|nr:3'(2'),5'-bisphosphate nucleotidase CysQ [Acidimicrobiia bacterium]
MTATTEDLTRIHDALKAAEAVLEQFTPGSIEASFKQGDDPLTKADLAVDELLHELLPRDGEGWLSEETADDSNRLSCSRVWVGDPIDGTREFVEGLPQWCVSIGLVRDGQAIAGGIVNPAAGELILGAPGHGVTLNGAEVTQWPTTLDGGEVLASNSEIKRGEWDRFMNRAFAVVPMGSVAYKLARVGAGLAEATWTLVPKNEWDIAAGVAIVQAAGGYVGRLDGSEPTFNNPSPKYDGLIAAAPGLDRAVLDMIGPL